MSKSVAIQSPADLTKEWLSEALDGAKVRGFESKAVGTGQMSDCFRIKLQYEADSKPGPASVILKVPSTNSDSRQAGVILGLYEREVKFYAEVATLIGGPLSKCYHASYADNGTFCLLLGDASPSIVGDDVQGATLEQAKLAMRALGNLHAPTLDNHNMDSKSWLNRPSPISKEMFDSLLGEFFDRFDHRLTAEHHMVCQRLSDSFDSASNQDTYKDQVKGIIHGDYRLDNILLGQTGAEKPVTVVDFQTVTWGPAMSDVAYFLGGSLPVEIRRKHQDELIQEYYSGLGENPKMSISQCKEGIRRQSFFGVSMAIISSILVEQTDRGDEMFMAMLQRHCTQVMDLNALETLGPPKSLTPLRPSPTDEGTHQPGVDKLWQESWYFDFADAEQEIGGYVRVGVDPARNKTWYTAMICGPNSPTVAVVDFEAPLPEKDLGLKTEKLQASQGAEVPLQKYYAKLDGQGESFADPSLLLREEKGTPVQVKLDLQWTTQGEPYQYRLTTRYEIPCRVSGTISVDGKVMEINAAGQRDHSWGSRDWWSMDWVWSAVHLDDGTRLHGLDLRIPGAPKLSVGYIQGKESPISELSKVVSEEKFSENGLPISTQLSIAPGDMTIDLEILGHGPLRLQSDDGRVAMFPRAWGRVKTNDGRKGVAWMEWNRNLR